MKKFISLCLLAVLPLSPLTAQSDLIQGTEVGVDLAFSAGTQGGNFGIGAKYGWNLGEYFIAGPSARYEILWWKNQINNVDVASGQRHVYGGGVFGHARFWNAIFLGVEFEMLKSPYDQNGFYSLNSSSWAPTLFLGGGFSMEFQETVRLNAGIMYDVINAGNSPFRNSYNIQKQTADGMPAGYLPIIYRIAFFFPLTRN